MNISPFLTGYTRSEQTDRSPSSTCSRRQRPSWHRKTWSISAGIALPRFALLSNMGQCYPADLLLLIPPKNEETAGRAASSEWFMHRMRGADDLFLYLERPHQPQTLLAVGLLRSAEREDGTLSSVTLHQLREHIANRIDVIPVLRWRVVPVPLGLDHTILVEDSKLDIRQHTSQVTIPNGSSTELDEFCALLASKPMDLKRPLWHIWLVDGLSDDRQAVIIKLHHCLTDATAATASIYPRLFGDIQLTSSIGSTPRMNLQGTLSRLCGAVFRKVRSTSELPRLAYRTRRNLLLTEKYRLELPVTVPT